VSRPGPEIVEPGRAFDLKVAVLLAATVSVVLLIAGGLNAESRYGLAVWPGLALVLAGAWGGFAITQLA
jgi:hypothetical protein